MSLELDFDSQFEWMLRRTPLLWLTVALGARGAIWVACILGNLLPGAIPIPLAMCAMALLLFVAIVSATNLVFMMFILVIQACLFVKSIANAFWRREITGPKDVLWLYAHFLQLPQIGHCVDNLFS